MNKSSESESSYPQRNMSKGAASQVAAGASPQYPQSQPQWHGQTQSQPAQQNNQAKSSQASGASAKNAEQFDPVCGMAVDVTDELVERYQRSGKTFYFCSSDCREQYEATPDDFES